ncbi:hypothetical protein ACG3SL_12725 [Sphingomonas sp. CJ20]
MMTQLGQDERHWLESNWTSMSRSVLNIVVPLADDVIEATITAGEPSDPCWTRFVDRAARALDRIRAAIAAQERGGAGPGRSSMYAAAISLFGDADPMREELIRARERLSGKEGGAVAWACLRSGLYRMRLRATADVENRAKTWQRLRPIVALVRDGAGWHAAYDDPASSYSDELCELVAAHVRAHHASDHNLPREADRVKGFFAQFCEDFFEPDEVLEVTEDDVEMLPDLERGLAYLRECAKALVSPFAEVYETSLHRGDTTVSAFCLRAGMDRRRFHHIRVKAEAQLTDCVTRKLRERMMAAVR